MLGIFRRGTCCFSWRVLVDGLPVYLILLYNIWPMITIRFLSLVFCSAFPSRDVVGVQESRLMFHPDVICSTTDENAAEQYTPVYRLLSVMAWGGIGLYSFGFIVAVAGEREGAHSCYSR